MNCVPLSSASASLGRKSSGSRPRSRSASPAGCVAPPSARKSPSPSSGRNACAEGARSPLAPTDPVIGTAGVKPSLRKTAIRSSTSLRIPECARIRQLSRTTTAARTSLCRQQRSNPSGVAAKHRALDRRIWRSDRLGHERTEPRRHAVDGCAPGNRGLEVAAVCGDRLERRRLEVNRRAERYFLHGRRVERPAVDASRVHRLPVRPRRADNR